MSLYPDQDSKLLEVINKMQEKIVNLNILCQALQARICRLERHAGNQFTEVKDKH